MWPFSNRGPRLDVEETLIKHKPDFDFEAFKHNDVYIKLWMPELLVNSIDILSIQHNVSRPDILRWILFDHAYGRELFARLCAYAKLINAYESEIQIFPNQYDDLNLISFSRKQVETERSINQRFLREATENVKLWLPRPLKDSLQTLGDIKAMELSDYLRGMVLQHLWGEGSYNEWEQALADIKTHAKEHENPVYSIAEDENLIEPPMWS